MFAVLFLFIYSGHAADNVLLNGTRLYLTQGDSYGFYQGYVLTLKSVSNQGSAWLELSDNDSIVKSDIIHLQESFSYSKNNKTIISLRFEAIYSGSRETKLVSFFPVYQYLDREKASPEIIEITSTETTPSDINNENVSGEDLNEPVMWGAIIILIIVLSYMVYKLW